MPTSRRNVRDAKLAMPTAGRLVRFGRDVAVNVIANLVAAAIIYLVATLSGLLPRNHTVYLTALALVTVPLAFLLYLVAKIFLRGRKQLYALGICMVLGGIGATLTPFVPDIGLNSTDRALYPIMGVFSILAGAAFLIELKIDHLDVEN